MLIGYSLCIDGCGEQETYNTASRECEAIPDTNNNSTTTTPTETIDLDFIPLPYAIIGIICTTIVIVVHFTHKILILPILLGLSSSLLFLSALTLFIVEYTLYTTIRDGTYILLGALGVSIFLNIILIIIFIRNIEEKKWICFLALILGFKNLAFLCANIKGINFRKKYEAFWEIFDKMVIACIFTSLALITAGVLYSFHYKLSVFPFYGGIELLVLGIMDLLTTIFWLIWDHEAE